MSQRKTPQKPKISYEYSVEKMMKDLNSHEKEKKTKKIHKVTPLTKEQIQKRMNRYSLEKVKMKDGKSKRSPRKRSHRKRSQRKRSHRKRSHGRRSKKVVKTL